MNKIQLLQSVKELANFAEVKPETGPAFWKLLDQIQWEVNKFAYDNGKDLTDYVVGMPPPCPHPPDCGT